LFLGAIDVVQSSEKQSIAKSEIDVEEIQQKSNVIEENQSNREEQDQERRIKV
jgi:hypothetical protein